MTKRTKSDLLVFLILGCLLSFSVSLCVLYATILPFTYWQIAYITFGFIVLYGFVFYNRYTFMVGLIFLALYALFFFMTLSNESVRFYSDLWLFVRGFVPYEQRFALTVIVCVCALVTLATTLFLYVQSSFLALFALGISVFMVNWLMDYPRSDVPFFIWVFCIAVMLIKRLNALNTRTKRNSRFVLCSMPVVAVVVFCISLIPRTDPKISNQSIVDALSEPINSVNDFFYAAFNPKFFSFQTTGFTDRNGRLGGSIVLDSRNVMEIVATKPSYLKGLVKDIYTGESWLNSRDGYDLPYDNASALKEAREVFLSIGGLVRPQRFDEMTVNISTARTGTLFRPLNNFGIQDISVPVPINMNAFGDMRADDLLPAHTVYDYSYITVDYSDERVIEALNHSYKGYYADFAKALKNFLSRMDDIGLALERNGYAYANVDIIENQLMPMAGDAYDNFTALPDSLPQRVYDLADEITRDKETDYQKVKAIEEYLATFPYTLTPGPLPADRDFVDYFLFDRKEGYCTYYASAMAVMARTIGLPSRLCEGYIMPKTPNENGVYIVTNLQAHAWAEVYLEGFGWVPFEATAPYNYVFYNEAPPSNISIFSGSFMQQQYEDYINNMGIPDYVPSFGPADMSSMQDNTAANIPTIPAWMLASLSIISMIVLTLGGYVLITLINAFRLSLFIRRNDALGNNAKACAYYRGLMKLTRLRNYGAHAVETPSSYAKRVGKRFAFKNDTVFIKDIVKIIYRAKYGNAEISSRDAETVKTSYLEMIRNTRRLGKRFNIYLNIKGVC